MIFQQFNLVGRLDVLTNVLMGRLAHTPTLARHGQAVEPGRPARSRVAALEQLDIAELAAQRADTCRAASSSASRSAARWCRSRRSSSPTSRSPRSIRATRSIVMDALQRINRHFGLTVLCNLHSLDLARAYCDRLIGMAAGRVVFDGAPARADRRRRPASSTASRRTRCWTATPRARPPPARGRPSAA